LKWHDSCESFARRSKKITMTCIKICVASLIFYMFACSALLGNGLNLNSLGTRALSMGGAFTGLADDFSAIYWNPAGMGFFRQKHFGFYGSAFIPDGSYRLSLSGPPMEIPIADAKTESRLYPGGMLAYYHPVGKNLVAGIGVYTPSASGVKWHGADLSGISNWNPDIDWQSQVGVVTIAPGIAFTIKDILSIGAALNINYGMFDAAGYAGVVNPVQNMVIDLGQYEESMDGWGYGATFGVLARPNKILSLGATFRTASRINFSGEASISNLPTLGFIMGGHDSVGTTDLEREVIWPMWLSAGIAISPIENLTVTADIQFTQWSRTKVIPYGTGDIDVGFGAYILTDYKDTFWKLMIHPLRPMFWEDTLQLRFGAEYRHKSLAVRGGYSRNPSPTPDRTLNILLPSFDFDVLTCGIGYSRKNLQFDVGLEYWNGNERNIPLEKTLGDPFPDPDWAYAMPGEHRMSVVIPNISLSFRF